MDPQSNLTEKKGFISSVKEGKKTRKPVKSKGVLTLFPHPIGYRQMTSKFQTENWTFKVTLLTFINYNFICLPSG